MDGSHCFPTPWVLNAHVESVAIAGFIAALDFCARIAKLEKNRKPTQKSSTPSNACQTTGRTPHA